MKRRALSLLAFVLTALWARGDDVGTNVTASPAYFNPSRGEHTTVWCSLFLSNTVIHVSDPDGGLVRTFREAFPGQHEFVWDGKDWSGKPVPDEAYTFVVEGGVQARFDPFANSGGSVGDVKVVDFSKGEGTVSYSLPTASRVLVRLGVKNGPMHRTLVDWKPRPAGAVTEHWDGMDEDKAFNLWDHKDFSGI